MDGRCDVCGCKTEAQDMKKYTLSAEPFDVCVFCRKQLENISAKPAENAQAAVNMLYMDTKGKRDERCFNALKGHFEALGIDTSEPQEVTVPQAPKAFTTVEPTNENEPVSLEEQVAKLQKQVDELDARITKFRSRYLLSRILGMVIPVVFVFIMLIILLASGALQNIFDYYGMLTKYANM